MINKHSLLSLFIFALVFASFSSRAQSFEGWIQYKTDVLNPMPDKIPDSTWEQGKKERLGGLGYILQKYFYKNDDYMSEMDMGTQQGFQLYDKKNNLLYSWKKNSDTARTTSTLKNADDFLDLVEIDKPETVLGIPCKAIVVKTKFGNMTIWYNPDYFKVDPKLYENHKYGNWQQIIAKTGALPLKVEQKGFMIHTVQIAIEYKKEAIPDSKFEIPKFKTVLSH